MLKKSIVGLSIFLWVMMNSACAPGPRQWSDYRYTASKNTVAICEYIGPGGDVVIPDTIDEMPVVGIRERAFRDCTILTSLVIPATVSSIGKTAFRNCTSLTSVAIPATVTSIGDAAFRNCISLTSLVIPASLTSIALGTFAECTGLISVDIPASVTSIGYEAFQSCTSLTNVVIPASVTNIGDFAFQNCSSLTSVVIPASVTNIGDFAFGECSGLTSISVDENNQAYSSRDGVLYNKAQTTLIQCPERLSGNFIIPTTVTSIGDFAFSRCTNVTSIEIPASVTSIGRGAFYGCTGLTSIHVDENNQVYSSRDGVLYNKTQSTLIQSPEGRAGAF